MSSARRWWLIFPPSNTPTRRLSRSTVIRSAISMSSTSRWLTKTTAMPAAESRRTTSRSDRVSDWVSDAVGSSMNTNRRLRDEGAADRDHLAVGDRERPDGLVEVEVEAEAPEHLPRGAAHRGAARGPRQEPEVLLEGDVLGDAEVREEGEVLPDDLDAESAGHAGGESLVAAAFELDGPARVRLVDAAHDLDEGALARAVLPREAVDLAGVDLEVDVDEGVDPSEVLGDAGEANGGRGSGRTGHRRGRLRPGGSRAGQGCAFARHDRSGCRGTGERHAVICWSALPPGAAGTGPGGAATRSRGDLPPAAG